SIHQYSVVAHGGMVRTRRHHQVKNIITIKEEVERISYNMQRNRRSWNVVGCSCKGSGFWRFFENIRVRIASERSRTCTRWSPGCPSSTQPLHPHITRTIRESKKQAITV